LKTNFVAEAGPRALSGAHEGIFSIFFLLTTEEMADAKKIAKCTKEVGCRK